MRSWLTAPPLLFWQICLAALLAGGWATQYPGYGAAGLLLTATAAWPFLRREGGYAALAGRLAILGLVFALGFGFAAHAVNRPAQNLPDYIFDRSGHQITATIKEITALPPRAPLAAMPDQWALRPEPGFLTKHAGPEAYRLLLVEVTVFPEDPDLDPIKLPGNLLWTWNVKNLTLEDEGSFRPPMPGQHVAAHLRLREMRGFSNPGVMDNADRQVRDGTLFRAYSDAGQDEAVFSGEPAWGQQNRRILYEHFLAALGDPGDPADPGRAVLPALLFGDRAYLTDSQTDLFAKASLSHSLALSGLHLGFMAGLGWMLARLLCRLFPGLMLRLPRAKWAVLCAVPLVLSYLWLGGLSPSLLRAALMFTCWGVFVLLDRPHPLLDGLCAAVLMLFLADPLIIFDLRLQLSALCVLAIGLTLLAVNQLAQRLVPRLPPSMNNTPSRFRPVLRARLRNLLRGGLTLICISAAIQVALTPIQADIFNQATPWFVLNLLWLPVLSAWVFPWAVLGLALCAVPGLALPATWALDLAAFPATWLFNLLNAMDAAHILVAPLVVRPHGVSILGYATVLTALFLCLRHLDLKRMFPSGPRQAMGHVQILLLTGFLCLGFGIWERYHQEHPPGLRVRMLDVGQGLSMLLEGTAGQRILVDGGGSPLSSFNVGEYVLIPLLTDNRPPRLDAVINTHPDADHLRGLLPVLRRLNVDAVWLTRPPREAMEKLLLDHALAEADLAPGRLYAGQRLDLDSRHYLEILYPSAVARGGRNQLSLAARVVYAPEKRGLFLLTGDLTKGGARRIMKEAKIGDNAGLGCDAVQAPHHGSKNSLVKAFYEATSPKAAVVGAGHNNQWGFPSLELRETLRALDIPLLNTAEDGQIILRWDAGGHFLAPERAKQAFRPDN